MDATFTLNDSLFANGPRVPSTDYVFKYLQLLEGYYLDTLTVIDTVHQSEYIAYYVQSSLPGKEKLNKAVLNEVQHHIRKEQQAWEDEPYDEPSDEQYYADILYTYELGPIQFFANDKVVSIYYMTDTYGAGGNHHNYSYYTFNYDLQKNKVIRFSDAFVLPARKDSLDFVDEVGLAAMDAHQPSTTLDMPFTEVGFSFSAEGIYINFYESRALLAPKNLAPFIKPEWKTLYK